MLHLLVWRFAYGIVIVIAGYTLFLRLPRRGFDRTVAAVFAADGSVFQVIGGASWYGRRWPLSASFPFVRLELFEWGIRIGPARRTLAFLLPTTELEWSEVKAVKRTRAGVRITPYVPHHGRIWFGNFNGLSDVFFSALISHGVDLES